LKEKNAIEHACVTCDSVILMGSHRKPRSEKKMKGEL